MKLQLSQKEEIEPAENTENTEKLGNTIMGFLFHFGCGESEEILDFVKVVRNLHIFDWEPKNISAFANVFPCTI